MSVAVLVLLLAADKSEPRLDGAAKPAPAEAAQVALLGKTNTDSGESRRNENVQFNLIDNNAAKELSQRMGTSATIYPEFAPSRNYFGGEFGAASTGPMHLSSGKRVAGIRGSAFWTHSNSVTSARSFFQVGGVLPARENHYGVAATVPLWKGAWFSADAAQHKIRGQVNGNVLIPKPDERTPLATDPQARAIVERWFRAWPLQAPNRTDIDPRALNTNALQAIDTDQTSARLDQSIGDRNRLMFRHTYTNQNIDAFQFVAGQNPDTTTKNHSARATWQRIVAPATNGEFSMGFDRVHSLLVPEPNAVGPQVQVGTAYTALGPGSSIPIDRVQNRYRYAALVNHQKGSHRLTAGGEVARLQFNGREASSNRTNWFFRNDFGRDAITNFRLGTATRFTTGIGDLDRGFRNWEQQYFVGDVWQARSDLSLNFGLRYQPQRGPYEVNDRTMIPYRCDCNNFAPRFGLAWRLPGSWGVFRAAYGLQYGEIFPITFQQLRWNPPEFIKAEAQAPNFLDPLAGADLSPTGRALVFQVPENLKAPYSHQYNASWEAALPAKWRLQIGYVGSRTHKLFLMWHNNRARVVPGIPQTTATINERRPDSRFFELRPVQNGSRSYFDAGRVTVILPNWRRLTVDASYWFSKALDTGATYLNTAAGDDTRQGYSQSEFLVQQDLKGPSLFDQSHAALARVQYELPAFRDRAGWLGAVFGSWNLSTVTLKKSGIPFSVISGSDSPGFGNVDGTNGDRPNLLNPSVLGRTFGHPDDPRPLLRSDFAYIQPTQSRGNLGMGTFRRGGLFNVNAAVFKTWPIRNERGVTVRAEVVNLTNTPQFAEPIFDLTNPAFGKITNTLNDGRAFRATLQMRF